MISPSPAPPGSRDATSAPERQTPSSALSGSVASLPSGSSAYYAFLFVAARQREAIAAWHAYCHEVRHGVRRVSDASVAEAKLAWWEAEIGRAFAGQPSHPLTRALLPHARAHGIAAEAWLQVVEAARIELRQSRWLDFAALQRHGALGAGVALSESARVLGASHSLEPARRLGQALLLVRQLRDIGHDAASGRVNLPLDELQRFDVKAHEILALQASDRFVALVAFQAARARDLCAQALAGVEPRDRRAFKPLRALARMHLALLDEIGRAGAQRLLSERVSLTPLRKFWLSWQVQALGR